MYGSEGPDGSSPYVDTFVESTAVDFGVLPADVIDAYIASGEPMDKAGTRASCRERCASRRRHRLHNHGRPRLAGSYGIQGAGGSFVSGIRGCYHNVVGFPMHRFCTKLDLSRLKA